MKMLFKKEIWFAARVVVLAAVFINPASSAPGADELTAEQKALKAEVEHSLVAPCCWNMTVDQHDSPTSRKVRDEIANLVRAGKNKEEILRYFSSQPQYGERILATPSQDTLLGKSAYWLIPIAILFGGCVVVVAIRKMTSRPAAEAKKTGRKPVEDSPLSERIEAELKDLDS